MRIFISHRKVTEARSLLGRRVRENAEAGILHEILADASHQPWMDNKQLSAGAEWAAEIYRQIRRSHVMIVLIVPGTSSSEWVAREIALATALGIEMVPLGHGLTSGQMTRETTVLGLDNKHWVITNNLRKDRGSDLLKELEPSLGRAARVTAERQKEILADLAAQGPPSPIKAEDDQRYASFELRGPRGPVSLHVAAGDVARVRDIDVIVNSENDYMQMARFFESRTVSSNLRRRGSRTRNGRYEDTVQQELDWCLREHSRPVQASSVFPTSAGGPDSLLARENRARVILHVAAVQSVDAQAKVIPYTDPNQIVSCVTGAIHEVAKINRDRGIFSRQGTDQRAEQERLADTEDATLRTIIFPLFGTGTAGAAASDVVLPMLRGVMESLADGSAADLTDIYFSAFTVQDRDVVTAELESRLTRR